MLGSYIVGRWVRGADHYARQTLIEYFLTAQDHAFWLVGTRRMGKTSLLRHMELITRNSSEPWPFGGWEPLFWDLQGCTTPADLSTELYLSLEDEKERFIAHGVDIDALQGQDAVLILRRINRALAQTDKQLLLLVDEAEVFIEINEENSAWLARLRKAMQEGHQRTIVASTQMLTRLTAESVDWVTSPFLFGFTLTMLWPFDRQGAISLIEQSQGAAKIDVSPQVLDQILYYTHQHPFLIQYLCRRLYVGYGDKKANRSWNSTPNPQHSISGTIQNGTPSNPPSHGHQDAAESNGSVGYLRPIAESDLTLDHLLDAFFHTDFQQLIPVEKQILLTVSEFGTATEDQLFALLGSEHRAYLHKTLHSLRELGHLKSSGDGWVLSNEFLRRWLLENRFLLLQSDEAAKIHQNESRINEQNVDSISAELGIATNRTRAFSNREIHDERAFFETIQQFFGEIRHIVEQDDGHKLLVNTVGKGEHMLRSEEEIQIALKHWLKPMCQATNIDVNREPLSGRGFLDFKFSIGYDTKCIVEVKLFNSAKLLDGVGIQLPLYLLADRCKYGIYIPVFLPSPNYEKVMEQMREIARERAESHGVEIAVLDIVANKPKSASKADLVEDLARYGLTTLG